MKSKGQELENFDCKTKLPTLGELLFQIYEGFGLKWQKNEEDEKSKKEKERFKKEKNLTIKEYDKILNEVFVRLYSELQLGEAEKEDIQGILYSFRKVYNDFRINSPIIYFDEEDIKKAIGGGYATMFFKFPEDFNLIKQESILKGKSKLSIYNLIEHIAKQTYDKRVFWKNLKENFKDIRKDERPDYTEKFFKDLKKGKHIPDKDNTENLISALKETIKNFPEIKKFYESKISILVYFCRLLDYLSKNNQYLKDFIINPEKLKNYRDEGIEKLLSLFKDNKNIQKLHNLLSLERKKDKNDEKEVKGILSRSDTKNNYIYKFYLARHYVNQNKFKEAIKLYKEVVEKGKDCLGVYVKYAIKEGLVLSAHLTKENKINLKNSKSPFIYFLTQAYFLGLIKKVENLEKFILNNFKGKFYNLFRNRYSQYIENQEKEERLFARNLGIFSLEDIDKIKIDYKNPNKKIYYFKRPEHQLFTFASKGDYKAVKKLIEKGADVNYIRENDNYTALIASLENKPTQNHIKVAKILIKRMSTEALNAKLVKKKETALSYAIRYGLVDIVKLLIRKGVNLNEKITQDEISYIYLSLMVLSYIIGSKENPEIIQSMLLQDFMVMDEETLINISQIRNALKTFYPMAVLDEDFLSVFRINKAEIFNKIIAIIDEDLLPHLISSFFHRSIKNAKEIYKVLSQKIDNKNISDEEKEKINYLLKYC